MIAQGFKLFFDYFSMNMLTLAILISLIYRSNSTNAFTENVFRWVALLALGVTGIYTFCMHAFFPKVAAAAIGWSVSPFQYEVAVADLATGVLGICAFRASMGFRTATVLASAIWLWGDAIGHIRQMIVANNYAPGNAGSWFWMDIIIPAVLLVSLWKLRTKNKYK